MPTTSTEVEEPMGSPRVLGGCANDIANDGANAITDTIADDLPMRFAEWLRKACPAEYDETGAPKTPPGVDGAVAVAQPVRVLKLPKWPPPRPPTTLPPKPKPTTLRVPLPGRVWPLWAPQKGGGPAYTGEGKGKGGLDEGKDTNRKGWV